MNQETERASISVPPESEREFLQWALDTLIELNPSNYDHDDACQCSAASVEVMLAIQKRLASTTGAQACTECGREQGHHDDCNVGIVGATEASESPALPADEWLKEARFGKPYLDGLIDRLLMPLPSMPANDVKKLMGEAAEMIHQLAAPLSHLRLRLPEGSEPVADVVHGEIVMRVDADRLPHGAKLYTHPIAQAGDATNAAVGVQAPAPDLVAAARAVCERTGDPHYLNPDRNALRRLREALAAPADGVKGPDHG